MKQLTEAMCWEVVTISKDTVNGVGIAVYRKPTTNECYEKRQNNEPPTCLATDDPNAAWYPHISDFVIIIILKVFIYLLIYLFGLGVGMCR